MAKTDAGSSLRPYFCWLGGTRNAHFAFGAPAGRNVIQSGSRACSCQRGIYGGGYSEATEDLSQVSWSEISQSELAEPEALGGSAGQLQQAMPY